MIQKPIEPCSWIAGWLYVVGSGIFISAIVGVVTWAAIQLSGGIYNGDFSRIGRAFIVVPVGIIYSLPFAIVLTPLPLTVSYAVVRYVASGNPMTVVYRVLWGMVLGFATNIVVISSFNGSRPGANWYSLSLNYLFFPISEIQASAVAVLLIIRPRWLGLR